MEFGNLKQPEIIETAQEVQQPKEIQETVTQPTEQNLEEQIKELKEKLGLQTTAKKPQEKKIEEVEPAIAPKKVLENPKLSPLSKQVLTKLNGKDPFMVSATAYGKALSESILLQSEAIPGNKVNFEDEAKTKIEFKGSSFALIYKGNTPVRVSPFLWQLDQSTRRKWAVFTFHNFYGHKTPGRMKFWKNIKIVTIITPYEDNSQWVHSYGKGALAKFDEQTQFQMPIALADNELLEKIRLTNRAFISAALTLFTDLNSFTKPKLNVKIIMYLLIAAGAAIFLYWFFSTHPSFLSGLTNAL